MEVLVTGANGLIGRAICEEVVARGHTVRAMVRKAGSLQGLVGVQEVVGDVLDVHSLEEAARGCDAVVHTAAVVSFRKREHTHMKATNEGGTANVVNALLALQTTNQPAPRLVHISSVAALGRGQGVTTEQTSFNRDAANSYYAWTKHLAERQVYRGVEEGLRAIILNPSVVVGATQFERSSGVMVARAARGSTRYPIGTNGFVTLPDVARAACLALQDTRFNRAERFILNSENLSYKAFYTLLAEAQGKSAPVRPVPPWQLNLAARMLGLLGSRSPLTRETARTVNSEFRYDNSLFTNMFHFQFTPIRDLVSAIVAALRTIPTR